MCDSNEPENEIHFLFTCDSYVDLRLQHLGHLLDANMQLDYIDVLSNILCDTLKTKSLAKYIIDSLKRRRSLR